VSSLTTNLFSDQSFHTHKQNALSFAYTKLQSDVSLKKSFQSLVDSLNVNSVLPGNNSDNSNDNLATTCTSFDDNGNITTDLIDDLSSETDWWNDSVDQLCADYYDNLVSGNEDEDCVDGDDSGDESVNDNTLPVNYDSLPHTTADQVLLAAHLPPSTTLEESKLHRN
jgi:hypothetical protein